MESLQAAMGLSWFMPGYADSGQEKAQFVYHSSQLTAEINRWEALQNKNVAVG